MRRESRSAVDRRLNARNDVTLVVAVGPWSTLVRRGNRCLAADANGVVVRVEQPRWKRWTTFGSRSTLPGLLLHAPARVVGFEVLQGAWAGVVKDV